MQIRREMDWFAWKRNSFSLRNQLTALGPKTLERREHLHALGAHFDTKIRGLFKKFKCWNFEKCQSTRLTQPQNNFKMKIILLVLAVIKNWAARVTKLSDKEENKLICICVQMIMTDRLDFGEEECWSSGQVLVSSAASSSWSHSSYSSSWQVRWNPPVCSLSVPIPLFVKIEILHSYPDFSLCASTYKHDIIYELLPTYCGKCIYRLLKKTYFSF